MKSAEKDLVSSSCSWPPSTASESVIIVASQIPVAWPWRDCSRLTTISRPDVRHEPIDQTDDAAGYGLLGPPIGALAVLSWGRSVVSRFGRLRAPSSG